MTRARLVVVAAGGLASACFPAALAVDRAEELDAFQVEGVRGRDGGNSVRVGDHDVWIFGDTFLHDEDTEGATLHSSSFSVTADRDADDGIDGFATPVDDASAPRPFLPATDDERAYLLAHRADGDGACDEAPCDARIATWPGTSLVVEDRVLVFYELIRAAPGDFGFTGVGRSIATWTGDVDEVPERPILGDGDHPTRLFTADEPGFGTAAVVDGAFLYAFGCGAEGLAAPCRLARVRRADVLRRSAWTFYDGAAWVDDVGAAARVVDGAPIMTLTRFRGGWIIVHSKLLSNDVVARTADALTGPWSDAVLLFVADHGDDGAAYDAYLHPDLGDDDELIVSYTRNTAPYASVTVLQRVTLR